MFRWIKRKLGLTPRTLSHTKLSALANKKKRKDWERILDKMAEYAVSMAEQGKTFFTVNQDLLMNEYNRDRTKDQILGDVQKRFPRCECQFEFTITGQENIRISWQKNIDKQ